MIKERKKWMNSRIFTIVVIMVISWICVGQATAQPGNVVISGQQYWVDGGEADQGVTGNGKTVKAYADAIGTTKRATLVFDSKSGNSTSYVFTTAWNGTSYTNLDFEFKNGAMLAPGSGIAVVLPCPSNIIAKPSGQIFTGDGTVTFAKPGTVYPEYWGIDGTADEVQGSLAYASLTAGGTVRWSATLYTFAATTVMQSDTVTEIDRYTTVKRVNSSTGMSVFAAVSKSNIEITGGGLIDGNRSNQSDPDYSSNIYLVSCSGVKIHNVRIKSAYQNDIYLNGCTNVTISGCEIYDSENNGISMINSGVVKIRDNYLHGNVNSGGTANINVSTGCEDVQISNNTIKDSGVVAGESHGVYAIGGTGIIISGNLFDNLYGMGIESQPPLAGEGHMIVGNYFRDCGNPGDSGAMYIGGPRTIASNNFMTRSGLDGVYVTLADSSILSNNLIVNSGNSSHTGYGIRSIGDTVNPIIVGNMVADDRTPKYMDVGISISENSGIFVGNSVADTLSRTFGTAGNSVDQVFAGNRQGLNSVSAPLGNRDQNSFVSDTLTGNASLDRLNNRICHFAASGADRNADPVSVWKAGDDLWIKNVGTTYDVVFDSSGLHQHLTPGQMGHFVYNGSAWVRLAYDAGQSLPLTGFLTGLMPPVNVVKPSGTSTNVPSETVLTHADDGSPTNAYVGMTLYNVTDWVAGTVTASTSTTITVATGSMSWADGDVYQLSPGPAQSGSMFYIGTAGTIRHPLTAGYSAGYFVNVAGVVTVDMVSDSMIFQGVLNGAFAVLDAGDCIDSPATKGSYYVIHNKSATEAVGLGFSNVWVDGGAS